MGIEIEKNLIAAALADSRYIDFEMLRGIRSELFQVPQHRRIFTVLETYRGKQTDFVSISSEHPEIPLNDLLEIQDVLGNSEGIESWIGIFLKEAARRKAEAVLKEALCQIEKKDLPALIQDLNGKLSNAANIADSGKVRTLQEVMDSGVADLTEQGKNGIPCFEAGTEGREKFVFQKGRIAVIAAESGMGKTELSLGCVVKPALEAGKRVLYICTESPAGEIGCRLAGLIAGVSYSWINTPSVYVSEASKTAFFGTAINTIPQKYTGLLFIKGSDDSVCDTVKIERAVTSITAEHGPVDLLVVDYLQDLRSPEHVKDDSEYTLINKNMADLKRITDKYGCATLLNCQLNRTESKRSEKPNKFRLRGSEYIGNESHVLAFLWKDPEGKYHFYSDKVRGVQPFDFELSYCKYGYVSNRKP